MKKLIAIVCCLYLAAHLFACSSDSVEGEEGANPDGTENVEGAGEAAAGDQNLENVEGSLEGGAATGEETAATGEGDLPAATLGEETPPSSGEAPPPGDAPPPSGDSSLSGDKNVAAEAPPPEGFNSPPPMSDAPPPGVDTTTGQSSDSSSTASSDSASAPPADEPPPVPKASLKKVETTPFPRGGQQMNGVYIARPDDTYKSIAKLIYGDEAKSKDLKKGNPSVSKPKPGDKIYYNSAKRPADDTKIMNYYEELELAPESYEAKEGDNLKTVGKQLLGYPNAWKELWVTNSDLESKGALSAGTVIKYWKGGVANALPPMNGGQGGGEVATALPTPPPADMLPPPPPELPPLPPPPTSGQQAQTGGLPPPPGGPGAPPPAAGAGGLDLPPPPEPPQLPGGEAGNSPPPPGEEPGSQGEGKKSAKNSKKSGEIPEEQMMAMGAGGLAVLGIVGYMISRRRKQQREMQAAFQDTHVG